jgi:excinuclease ABC subunit C
VLSKDGIIEFKKDSNGYLLLQEIRDESHRFAINAQRKKKNAKNRKSQLDSIEGIGVVLKKRLLMKFKSIKNIKSANVEDLMTVKGINVKIAKLIKEKL